MAVYPLRISRVRHLFLPSLRLPLEGVIRQLHHTFDRREVRSENAPPGLHTVLPGCTAGPATHAVDDLVNFLWRRPGLVGGVDGLLPTSPRESRFSMAYSHPYVTDGVSLWQTKQ